MDDFPAPRAVLTDFGGVLTTSVLEAFSAVSEEVSGDPGLLVRLLRDDGPAAQLLVDHECGRIGERAFESGIVKRLQHHGADLRGSSGLVRAIQSHLRPDTAMLDAICRLRLRGVRVAIVSNSLGDDCYSGYDLGALADIAVISSQVGIRKPARRVYAIACERLGVEPEHAVMIDDLEHNLRGAARLGIRGVHHTDSAETIRVLDTWFRTSPNAASPRQVRG
jgi:putative hydrolase of the HAD superfamily